MRAEHANQPALGVAQRRGEVDEAQRAVVRRGGQQLGEQFRRMHVDHHRAALGRTLEPWPLGHAGADEQAAGGGAHLAARVRHADPGVAAVRIIQAVDQRLPGTRFEGRARRVERGGEELDLAQALVQAGRERCGRMPSQRRERLALIAFQAGGHALADGQRQAAQHHRHEQAEHQRDAGTKAEEHAAATKRKPALSAGFVPG